jgi:hypothetical protein
MTGYKRYHSHSGMCQRLHNVTPEQFEQLLDLIPEPSASMVFVAVWTGLRVSELIGLKWDDVGTDSLTVDERCCRGDGDAPKSEASNATIGVESFHAKSLIPKKADSHAGSATNPPFAILPLLVLSEVHSEWVRNSGSWWWGTVAASRGNLGTVAATQTSS